MKFSLKSYCIWEQGPRQKQEDSLYPEFGKATDDDRLFLVCDGMGGHSAGEVASRTVCATLSKSILSNCKDPEGDFSDEMFRNALSDAYDELDKQDNGATKKMGTTLTFLKLHKNGATIAHIGDSRVYHIRPAKNPEETEILFQTIDHSLVNDLVKIGELTPEEAKNSNQKNIITRAVQPNMDRRHKAEMYHTNDIKPGDYFMLCSDGILEQLEDDNLKFIFSDKGGDAQNKTKMLIQVTEHNHDNHTAIIVHIQDVINDLNDTFGKEHKYLEAEVLDDDEKINPYDDKYHITDGVDDDNGIDDVNKPKMKHNKTSKRSLVQLIIVVVAFLLAFLGFKVYKNISDKNKTEEIKEQKIETYGTEKENQEIEEKQEEIQQIKHQKTSPQKKQKPSNELDENNHSKTK